MLAYRIHDCSDDVQRTWLVATRSNIKAPDESFAGEIASLPTANMVLVILGLAQTTITNAILNLRYPLRLALVIHLPTRFSINESKRQFAQFHRAAVMFVTALPVIPMWLHGRMVFCRGRSCEQQQGDDADYHCWIPES